MDKQLELLQGTLDVIILKAVSLGPLHGYGVFAAHSTDFKGSFGDSARLSLSGPGSPRPPRLDHERMGRVGEQAQGKVLPAHGGRQTQTAHGHRKVEAYG